MKSEELSLATWRSKPQKVFVGREAGKVCREHFKLDELDEVGVRVQVEIPPETYSVNSSFFLGMFSDSIRALGEEQFRFRYKFVGKNISRTVNDGIRHALDTASPLPVAATSPSRAGWFGRTGVAETGARMLSALIA